MAPSRSLHALLHLVTGSGLLAGAMLIHLLPNAATHWQLLREPLQASGLVVLLVAVLRRHPRIARLSSLVCLSLLATVLAVTILELGFRMARFDFRNLETARRALPPFYRKPTVPSGGAYFRRAGPDHWQGQVIRTCLQVLRMPDEAYREEPVVEIWYDSLGFRNESAEPAWEVAVAGDSFTELGFLPHEQLFTTVLAQQTGWRVRNLGVSHTGPLTQLGYLGQYGISPATQHLVIVFYEGNDFQDLDREQRADVEFRRTGRHDSEESRPQTSMLGAFTDWISRHPPPALPEATAPDAFWAGPTGEVPLTFENTAPNAAELAIETQTAFDRFLAQYAALAEARRARAWLAYMPCKLRVLFGRVRLTATGVSSIGNWSPTDLPQWVGERCARAGVMFVDLTPGLIKGIEAQHRLPYNALYDTHLNAFGSELVGKGLAETMRAHAAR